MEKDTYRIQKLLPLIIILAAISVLTFAAQFRHETWNHQTLMYDFMGVFFLVFGSFKLIKLSAFAEAYSIYDPIAQKSIYYAYAYPFIELALGIGYLMRLFPAWLNVITLILMLINAYGVTQQLLKRNVIECACLGTVFKLPMTYVTLFEDLIMAAMAAYMLFKQ